MNHHNSEQNLMYLRYSLLLANDILALLLQLLKVSLNMYEMKHMVNCLIIQIIHFEWFVIDQSANFSSVAVFN